MKGHGETDPRPKLGDAGGRPRTQDTQARGRERGLQRGLSGSSPFHRGVDSGRHGRQRQAP